MVNTPIKLFLKLGQTLLKELGLADDTIFIFTADTANPLQHNYQTLNGVFKGGKGTFARCRNTCFLLGSLLIPSKIKTGFDYNELFGIQWIFPTLAEAAGLPIPEKRTEKLLSTFFQCKPNRQEKLAFIHYDPLKRGK